MNNDLDNKKEAIEYLYGELTDAKLDAFEERLFVDEQFSLFVDDVENDLVDEYIRGELEFEQKREFEKKYLTTDSRHERVAVARTLQEELFEKEKVAVVATADSPTLWQSLFGFLQGSNLALAGGLATILLLVLIGGIWIAMQPNEGEIIADGGNQSNQDNQSPIIKDLPKEVSPTPTETPTETPEIKENKSDENVNTSASESAKPTPKVKDSKANKPKATPKPIKKKPKENKKPKTVVRKPSVFVASLFPPLRSSQNPVLKIPSSAKTVRLQLFDNFGQSYDKFIVELNNSSGTTILTREINASKKRPQKSIGISLPENVLKAGIYEIGVKGIKKDEDVEEINFYNFVVQRDKAEKK